MPEIAFLIESLVQGKNLKKETVESVFHSVLEGGLTPAQTASFLTALRIKGETPEELTGAVKAMIARAHTIGCQEDTVDLCGTGGDSKGTFNISTTASFIAAGAGVCVAKHGNRSVSSLVGSADVLEAAGVKIDMDLKTAERCLESSGITFLFAPVFHPSMKNVSQIRREMGIRTSFNILGPLVNPGMVKKQVVGVPSTGIMTTMANTAKILGLHRCMVVCGKDGMDEITVSDKTEVSELAADGSVRRYLIDPKEFGIKSAKPGELKGGLNAAENAAIMTAVLDNTSKGAKTDAALLNAAAAIYVSGRTDDMYSAFKLAKQSLESGAAVSKLKDLTRLSTNLGKV